MKKTGTPFGRNHADGQGHLGDRARLCRHRRGGARPALRPVAAACVVMPPEPLLLYVDDSKKLTEKRREELYDKIMRQRRWCGR